MPLICAKPGDGNLCCTRIILHSGGFLKFFHPHTKVVLINDNKCSLLRTGGLYHKTVYYVNKLVYPLADQTVAAHTPAAQDIAENYHVIPEKMHVIYHPLIDIKEVEAAPVEKGHPFVRAKEDGYKLLLTVGRLVPEKAFENLIDAVALVRKEEKVKLIILGEGEQRAFLQEKSNPSNWKMISTFWIYNTGVFFYEERGFVCVVFETGGFRQCAGGSNCMWASLCSHRLRKWWAKGNHGAKWCRKIWRLV